MAEDKGREEVEVTEEDDDDELYGYQEYDDGSFELEDIDDDELFGKVAAEFESIMNEEDEDEDEE